MTPRARQYTESRRKAQQNVGRTRHQRLWSAMRIERTFTVLTLIAICELEEKDAGDVRRYIAHLRKAGFIRTAGARDTRVAIHTLVRNTGPHCPSVVDYARAVWDPNTDEVHRHG